MAPRGVTLALALLIGVATLPAVAGPTSHALELTREGSVLFVDVDRGRLLRLEDNELTVYSDLDGVPAGDHMQNLVLTISGELYLGEKKSVWKISEDGSVAEAKPPPELKVLFVARPGDLAPDGSVYVARDFRNINRSLPGGDAHPVLATDTISKIHCMSVTPYGRVFFGNTSEVAKLTAMGEVEILQELQGEAILGLAAEGENSVLVLRRRKNEDARLERVDLFGNSELLVSGEQIAAVSGERPLQILPSQ